MLQALKSSQLTQIATRELPIPDLFVKVTGIGIFILLTWLGAFISFRLPFTPVPITMQTFFVLLSGAVLGSRGGALSQGGYVLLGAAGIPLFAGAASGVVCLAGPTGGYLIGFILSAWLCGKLVEKCGSFLTLLGAMLVCNIVIYVCGSVWFSWITKATFQQTFLMAVFPFIGGDILKALGAVLLYWKISSRCRKIFQ